mgnify:CR=1 FL=1|tara:strand:+ start:69907 stop:70518 length:612 start_codon:yes stop_codon:yes gene_type:complete
MALIPVDDGQIATVVTHLEMVTRPRPSPLLSSPLRLARWKAPDPAKYRLLFRRVGEPWLWFSRLVLDDAALASITSDERVEIYAVLDPRGIEVGLLELDFRPERCCDIAFLALVPQLTGQGLGGWLMRQALMLGWRKGVEKMAVRTCTLDDPRALAFYIKAGFVPVRREIEIFDDPRARGWLASDAAPHVPYLAPTGTDQAES